MATLDDQSTDGTTASDQPGDPAANVDLAGIVQQAVKAALAEQDARFQGFQSLMDKKLASLSKEFKTARLSPEEQAQLEAESEEEDLDLMRRELELHRMRDKFPRGVQRLLALTGAESLEDQLALMESLEDPQAAAQAAEAIATAEANETPVPEVDPNNPARPLKAGFSSSVTGGEMTDEMADAILGAAG
jgi:hypothetical protein